MRRPDSAEAQQGTSMRTSWLLGVALGMFIGGFSLEAGMLALLVALPALVWALRSRTRASALGGLFLGAGTGQLGLLALAQMRCVSTSGPGFGSSCTGPDLTPYVVAAAVLIAIGVAISLVAIRYSVSRS